MTLPRASGRAAWLLLGLLACAARWLLADRAIWGIDGASNLWLASQIWEDGPVAVAQPSSQGVRNLPGAAWLLLPTVALRDLLSVTRALSLVQLGAMGLLARRLGGTHAQRLGAFVLLAFLPAFVGASQSAQNQNLCLTLDLLVLWALLRLYAADDGSIGRAALAGTAAMLAILEPAVHLAYFPDAAIRLGAVAWLVRRGPRAGRSAAPAVAAFAAVVAALLYLPWLVDQADVLAEAVAERAGRLALSVGVVVLAVALVRWRHRGERRVALGHRAVSVVPLLAAYVCCTALATGLVTKPISARDATGLLWLAAHGAAALALAPMAFTALRSGTRKDDGGVFRFAACVAGLTLLGRALLVPRALWVTGRPDLVLSLLPGLIAAAWLVPGGQERGRRVRVAALGALVAAFVAGALLPRSQAYWERHTEVVPPADMRDAVDLVASHHRAEGGGSTVDLAYDLELRREWVPAQARAAGDTTYTVGRPYDWLLWRRHRLRNAQEGRYERNGPARYRLKLPDLPARHGARPVADVGRLTILRVP